MTDYWRVTHSLDPVELEGEPPPYFDVRFVIDCEGCLYAIEHVIACAPHCNVVVESTRHLQSLVETLSYCHRAEVRIKWVSSTRLNSMPETEATRTRSMMARMDAPRGTDPRPVKIPSEKALISHDRLSVWLHLTNHARVEEDNAHALRDYYMVLEDLPGKVELPKLKCIRHARNFVSHGNKLYKNTRDFLSIAMGQKVDCYDPRERSHCQLVLEWRNEARKLVESQLDTLLRA